MIPPPKPWDFDQAPEFRQRAASFAKRHPQELQGCFNSLQKYLTILSGGQIPGTFKMGFMHSEPEGMVALDQGRSKGLGHLAEARLYTWADRASRTVVLLYIGTKPTQTEDLRQASEILHSWRSREKGSKT